MSEVRRRGKGVKPAMAHRTFRIPVEVLAYYEENFPNPSQKMRDVLAAYVELKKSSDWKSPLDQRDLEKVE